MDLHRYEFRNIQDASPRGWGKSILAVAAAVAFCALSPEARADQVFFADFETAGTPAGMGGTGSRVATSSFTTNYFTSGIGTGLWQNTSATIPGATTTLSLSSLGANVALTLALDFVAIGSWDGNGTGVAPDFFEILLNGATVYSNTFKNFGLVTPQLGSASGTAAATTTLTNLGFGAAGNTDGTNGGFGAATWHLAMTGITANGAGQANFQFRANGTGWQGNTDESVGLDNLSVSTPTSATPEPGTVAMALGGLAMVAVGRMRKRRAA